MADTPQATRQAVFKAPGDKTWTSIGDAWEKANGNVSFPTKVVIPAGVNVVIVKKKQKAQPTNG